MMATPRSVLVVVPRRIGDVLLATPLIRSFRRGWPGATVDALVFDGTEGILAANADLRAVLTVPERPRPGEHAAFLARLWRRYDLAVSVMPGDRPTLYAWVAGKRRAGTLIADGKSRWKRALLDAWVPFDDLDTHTVRMNLRLAELLGVEPVPEVVAAWTAQDEAKVRSLLPLIGKGQPFGLLHVSPMFAYKQWHDPGWAELAARLTDRGLAVVLTGGPASEEQAYVRRLLAALPPRTVNVAGQLSLAQVSFLASVAKLYVGPDTAVTHIAAATGTAVVALYGPSNPVKWGPWPKGHAGGNPFALRGSRTVGNVTLLQGETHCVPCLEEGCERHVRSLSDCLQHMPAARVIAAVESLLESKI